ncbi:4659_t:CDS:2, partial [Dentiscutata erythropus]
DEISSNHIASFSPINNDKKTNTISKIRSQTTNKRKPSFVRPYFEKTFDEKGKPDIHHIVNNDENRSESKPKR